MDENTCNGMLNMDTGFTLPAPGIKFPNAYYVGCLKSGNFPAYCLSLGLDLSAYVHRKRPREMHAAIRLTLENVDRWLIPHCRSDEELQAILSERHPAYYQHRVAA